MNFEEMKEKLERFGQTHVLSAYNRADEVTKEKLLSQVERINFEQLQDLFKSTKEKVNFDDEKIEPMPYADSAKLTDEERKNYIKVGEETLRSGKHAVVILAGGQGTRLGYNGPKGTFDIGLESHKSLFELMADYLKEACKKYNITIPWYIMTSKDNNKDTEEFFKEHNYFDYPKDNLIIFFKQGELPMLDEQGKVIINEEGIIKEAADGHGGIFRAMQSEGILDDMKQKGVEWIFVGNVDNPLVQMADPLLIGYAVYNNFLAVSKTIVKTGPEERVGVFCKKNDKPSVIEYTEITDEMAHMRDESGELVYGEAHMMLNLFNIQVFDKMKEIKFPYHAAHKKSNIVDEEGNVIVPEKPNAYKFEAFIFDAFPFFDKVGLLRGKREDDFAPVKNAEGVDSPETARKLYEDFQKRKTKK